MKSDTLINVEISRRCELTRGWGLSHHFTFLPVERDALGLPSGQSPAASPSPQLRGVCAGGRGQVGQAGGRRGD